MEVWGNWEEEMEVSVMELYYNAKYCFCVLVKRHKWLSALAVGRAVKRDQMLAGGKYTVMKDGSDCPHPLAPQFHSRILSYPMAGGVALRFQT